MLVQLMSGPVPMTVASMVLSWGMLWLRLSWRTRHEAARQEFVVAVSTALPAGSTIVELRPDGTWLQLIIGSARDSTVVASADVVSEASR